MGGAETTGAEPQVLLAGARVSDQAAFGALLSPHHRALHLHCYRMLGSSVIGHRWPGKHHRVPGNGTR
ncbi:hypothetical protein HS041_29405 [Planomonospora sp. ID67723]|nr:hypothetical protein [Planomonospora sp. ID67723]